MAEARFVCLICRHVFPESRARLSPVEPEEDHLACPRCGSSQIEPYPFDPDVPVQDLLEPDEEET